MNNYDDNACDFEKFHVVDVSEGLRLCLLAASADGGYRPSNQMVHTLDAEFYLFIYFFILTLSLFVGGIGMMWHDILVHPHPYPFPYLSIFLSTLLSSYKHHLSCDISSPILT